MSKEEGKRSFLNQASASPHRTPKRNQDTESMKENLSIGFRSLNDSVTLLEKLKHQVRGLGLQEKESLLKAIKKITAHVQLGERSLYLVLESGELVWKEEDGADKTDPS